MHQRHPVVQPLLQRTGRRTAPDPASRPPAPAGLHRGRCCRDGGRNGPAPCRSSGSRYRGRSGCTRWSAPSAASPDAPAASSQIDGGAGAQQAMVVVDEVGVAVVDPLVIRHMGIRRVDTNALGDDLGQRPAGADQIVVDIAGAFLVAHQAAVFQLVVETACRAVLASESTFVSMFDSLRLPSGLADPTLDMQASTTIVARQGGNRHDQTQCTTGRQHHRRNRRTGLFRRRIVRLRGAAEQPVRSGVFPMAACVFPIRSITAFAGSMRDRCHIDDWRDRRERVFPATAARPTRAQLNEPYGVVIDRAGRVLFRGSSEPARANDRYHRCHHHVGGRRVGQYGGDGGRPPRQAWWSPTDWRWTRADAAVHRGCGGPSGAGVDLGSRDDQHVRRHRRGAA